MHSVLVTVDLQPDRIKQAEEGLDAFIIPMCKQGPGFAHGIWWNSLDGTVGSGLITFDTESNAREMAEQHVDAPGDTPVTIRSVEVGKVYAEAYVVRAPGPDPGFEAPRAPVFRPNAQGGLEAYENLDAAVLHLEAATAKIEV